MIFILFYTPFLISFIQLKYLKYQKYNVNIQSCIILIKNAFNCKNRKNLTFVNSYQHD